MTLFQSENSLFEWGSVALYIFVALYVIVKFRGLFTRLQMFTINLILFFFIQREVNLLHKISLFFADQAAYDTYGPFVYLALVLLILSCLLMDRHLYYQLFKSSNKLRIVALLCVIILSQIFDALSGSSLFFLFWEEFLELLIPVFIFFVLENLRANKVSLT